MMWSNNDVPLEESCRSNAAGTGSAAIWQIIASQYYPQLLQFLRRLTSDPDLAEELAQQTFLIALCRSQQLTDDRSLLPWLYRIAHNQWRIEYRRRQRRLVLS